MPVIMHLSGVLWPSRSSVFIVLYVGSMCLLHVLVSGTSLQSWQHLLKHPHYADDGHQHARHVGTTRSRNTRLEDTQGQGTAFPITSFARSVGTTRSPRITPTIQSSVNSRTHYATSRSSVKEYVNGDQTASNASSSDRKELPTAVTATVTPFTVQSRQSASSGPSVIPTQAVHHARPSAVTFPPRVYYNVNASPEGFHKHRKNDMDHSSPPEQPKVLNSLEKEIENIKQANEHYLLMNSAGRCKKPRAQVVRVKDFHPDPSKEYLPRCTLLHRCNDQAGCCDAEGFRCMPRVMQEVALTFYVLNTGKESPPPDLGESVTKLLFLNHTECECLPVDNLPRAVENTPKSQQNLHVHEDQSPVQNNPSKCQACPLPFCKREYPDGRCACDCFDRQRPCLRIKRGREAMQEAERRCVETGRCHVPECEFGTFDPLLGRCPRKPEDHQRRGHHNQKNNHRWTFFERD